MQHIRSKHKDRPEPSINELREASIRTCMKEKNGEDEEKDPAIFDTEEVEDNMQSVIYEKGCESLRQIIRDTTIKYTKPTNAWKTRSTKNVFSYYVVNLLGKGNFFDIFDSTTARGLSCKNIKQEKQLFRVKHTSSVSNNHALVEFRNNSLLWILRQELQTNHEPTLADRSTGA